MAFEIKKDPKKWAICGTGTGWQLLPPNSTSIVFCLNDYVRIEKYGIRPDLLCIMDVLNEKPQIVSGSDNLGDIIDRINKLNVPLIAPYRYEEIPKSEAFPLQAVVERFGMPYFTNTICFMIAYALLKGAKEIDLFGVNQAGSHEYAEERGGVEYWLGVANGMGVKITINGKDSQVMKFKGRYGQNILYGYLQSYEDVIKTNKMFGESVVKRLVTPQSQVQRTIRRVNHES